MSVATLPAPIEWPVPYLDTVIINHCGVEGRCATCRQLKPIHFVYYGRNVAKGLDHGGWYHGGHYMECDACINEYISTRGDERTAVKDERKNDADA
jgi:hypothetical protein